MLPGLFESCRVCQCIKTSTVRLRNINCVFIAVCFRDVPANADDALRSKQQRQAATVSSSVVRPPPIKSSVQRKDSGTEAKKQHVDTRHVVQKMAQPDDISSVKQSEVVPSTGAKKHSSGDSREDGRKETVSSSAGRSHAKGDAAVKGASQTVLEGRRVSMMDEDEFEPDYDETETSEMEQTADDKSSLQSPDRGESSDKKHKTSHHSHRHKSGRQASSDVDESGSKTRKHKKQKKHKKHKNKTKSKKGDK